MAYRARLTRRAESDLLRLHDFALEREMQRSGGGDLELADRAIAAIEQGFATLRGWPFTCRKIGKGPFLR